FELRPQGAGPRGARFLHGLQDCVFKVLTMRLAQLSGRGSSLTAALVTDGGCFPIEKHSVADLIRRSERARLPLSEVASGLASDTPAEAPRLAAPITPTEVWACGCTYAPSAEFRDAELGTREGMYSYVHRAERPEIFFKGTARVCVGPGQPIG